MPSRRAVTALGVFLLVLAVYAIVSPGRIDMIDGQYRFEVARNIIDYGSVQIMDQALGGAVDGLLGAYSSYGISGSLVGLPLIALAKLTGPPTVDRMQVFFSFTSQLFSAATMALLFVFYTVLGVERRTALFWTFVAAFATLSFQVSTTVFDQSQHAFFIVGACLLAYVGAKRDSMALTAAGGFLLAVLVNFQETYAIVFPTLAIAALANLGDSPEQRKRAFERALVFVFVAMTGLVFFAGYNDFRFGRYLFSGKGVNHPSPLGNPIIGFVGLMVSPGKSIFLFSPPVFIALKGIGRLVRTHVAVGLAVVATVLMHLALISTVSFWAGDWCWGPRYFAATLPLIALAYPFATFTTSMQKLIARALIVAGLVVNLLGLSLDHHRFFYARALPAFFWYSDRSFYFRESQLFARPGEILDSIEHGVPPEAQRFRPGPYPLLLTYCIFGSRPSDSPVWMRYYSVFWLPRPWPLWMRTIPEEHRPIDIARAEALLGALGMSGLLLIWISKSRS